MKNIAHQMPAAKSKPDEDRGETVDSVTLTDRVLKTSQWTISIAQITRAEISQQSRTRTKPVALWIKCAASALPLALAGAGYLFFANKEAPQARDVLLAVLIGFAAAGGIWIQMSLRGSKRYTLHKLAISTSDGQKTVFSKESQATIDSVWRELTQRMDGAGPRDPVTINFEPESVSAPRESTQAPAKSSPPASSAPAASPRSQQGTTPDRTASNATPLNGRAQSLDTGYAMSRGSGAASNSPSRPFSTVASTNAPADAFVDFSTVLPAIVEMHRFYARQPGALHLEQRLSELELLMRAGTPTLSQKARLKELAVDMSQILQAYPQAVQLFDHVGDLAA